ncbi:MAG: galactokinase [Acidobacteriaceae bacterium]|nr:galactokinase [Acidobacteriaceae bacterium]
MLTLAIIPREIINAFREHFGSQTKPELYRAPGRVNLIGEHTDYNLGFVFPIALEMACYVAAGPGGDGKLRAYSRDFDEEFSIAVDDLPAAKAAGKWSDYVLGVARELLAAGVRIEGGNLYIASDVPLGSGLSSSAALEISTAYALLGPRHMDPIDIALLGQRAESQFVGMPCGIMDQYASVFGQEWAAIQIDCRSLEHEYVPLPHDVRIIAVNSMVKHELGTSAYRERVAECQRAVAAIHEITPDVESLRDVPVALFERIQDSVSPTPRRRARHVVTENQRVIDFAAAANAHNLEVMGRLFIASHRSMQYDYEISCEEIDFLVDTAIKLPGVHGARMTGGGFGGCTVNLVAPNAVENFRRQLTKAYEERFGKTPVFYDCKPADGAGRVTDPD